LERINIRQNKVTEWFLGRNAFETEVLYECDGEQNIIGRQMCRTANGNYARRELDLSMFYYFSRKLLPEWGKIDTALWKTLDNTTKPS
jgi:hypothetical protein